MIIGPPVELAAPFTIQGFSCTKMDENKHVRTISSSFVFTNILVAVGNRNRFRFHHICLGAWKT